MTSSDQRKYAESALNKCMNICSVLNSSLCVPTSPVTGRSKSLWATAVQHACALRMRSAHAMHVPDLRHLQSLRSSLRADDETPRRVDFTQTHGTSLHSRGDGHGGPRGLQMPVLLKLRSWSPIVLRSAFQAPGRPDLRPAHPAQHRGSATRCAASCRAPGGIFRRGPAEPRRTGPPKGRRFRRSCIHKGPSREGAITAVAAREKSSVRSVLAPSSKARSPVRSVHKALEANPRSAASPPRPSGYYPFDFIRRLHGPVGPFNVTARGRCCNLKTEIRGVGDFRGWIKAGARLPPAIGIKEKSVQWIRRKA